MKNIGALLFFFLLFIYSCTDSKPSSTAEQKRYGIIFDTDLGNDIDDVLALQMILNYAAHGKCDLLGVTISKDHPRVIDYVDSYCAINGFDSLPLGYAYGGSDIGGNRECGKYVCKTLDTIIDGKAILPPNREMSGGDIQEGYKIMRKALALQPDSSVVIITVGFATNLQRLLRSKPDQYSDLEGGELVRKKVRLLSIMSGTYNNDTFNNPEWNILQDLDAARQVFDGWPTQVVASGSEVGIRLLYPHESIINDYPGGEKHPLCVSYKLFENIPYDRPSWDLTSVLYAIEPNQSYLHKSSAGKISIDEKGFSKFTPDPDGLHHYLILKKREISQALDRIVEVTTMIRE